MRRSRRSWRLSVNAARKPQPDVCGCTFNFQCKRHQRGGIWAGEEWNEDLLADPGFEAREEADGDLVSVFAKPTEGDA